MELTLAQLAEMLEGQLEGPADRLINGIKGLEEADINDVAFLANPRYAKLLPNCRAGVVLVKADQEIPQGVAVIRVADPYLAYAKLLTQMTAKPYFPLGIHEKAVVEARVKMGQGVSIHALAYVGAEAVIGDNVIIHPGAYVGQGVHIGDNTVIHPKVTIYHGCKIGARCIIHAGTVIGADGFGFAPDGDAYFKIPQVGIVQIDDDVEIGANAAIDRAAMGRTWIQRGVKIDNMVHIAHNCVIGENTVLVAQVGISGSTKLGRHVVLGGQVGVGGHIEIGNYVQVAAQAGIAQPVEDRAVLSGSPGIPHRHHLRCLRLFSRLPELADRIKKLENKVFS